MGFLGGLFSAKNTSAENPKNYREIGLKTNPSNHGWYTCVHCQKKDLDFYNEIKKEAKRRGLI